MAYTHENSADANDAVSCIGSVRALHSPGQIENINERVLKLDAKLIGESRAMQALKKSILTAANCNWTVLITGESGTGKELIVRLDDDLSMRRCEPFLAVNCGALTESLLASRSHRKI